jgi:polysaccharide pyruvyl transferase WcaK-like protein
MNILFLGYYNHNNMGDDYFEFIFQKMFINYNIYFIDPNDLKIINKNIDILVCGGGDIINDYFMNKIVSLKYDYEETNNKKLLTYAISVGITYKLSIYQDKVHYLDIFDYFIVRNKTDANILLSRYDQQYVKYIPDIVHLIPYYVQGKTKIKNKNKPVIGIFLTETISNNGLNTNYDLEVNNFVKLIENLPKNYDIHLVPFNIGMNVSENDSVLNYKIYNLLSENTKKRVFLKIFNLEELLYTFIDKIYTVGLCMRYHSHILSYTYKIPFISISMTNKTLEYMKDMNITKYFINYATNPLFDIDLVINLIDQAINDQEYFNDLKINEESFIYPIKNLINRTTGPEYFNEKIYSKIYNNLIIELFSFIKKDLNIKNLNVNNIKVNSSLEKTFEELNIIIPTINNYNKIITKILINNIFGTLKTEYNYGLEEKVLSCDFNENIHYLIENKFLKGYYNKNKVSKNTNLNFFYVDNYFTPGIHRSGWSYVTKNLIEKFNDNNGNIIVDLYVDKTFLWNADINIKLKKIPYIKPWIGFIHHTPNPEYTDHSLIHILESEIFIASLKYCKGIIVLSEYLKNYLTTYFNDIIKINIKIFVTSHPTENVETKFTIEKFIDNKEQKIIQIGGWLRNSYSIYTLHTLNIQKCVLHGKEMENYIIPTNFNLNIISDNYVYNKFVDGLIHNLNDTFQNVNILNYLDNNEYDKLLENNIVFLNLINASACNTLIECVIRNTPIIINRLPAIEEVLGINYPLFYNNIFEASCLVNNIENIKKGYLYLTKLNKDKLNIKYLINDFNKIIKLIKE